MAYFMNLYSFTLPVASNHERELGILAKGARLKRECWAEKRKKHSNIWFGTKLLSELTGYLG